MVHYFIIGWIYLPLICGTEVHKALGVFKVFYETLLGLMETEKFNAQNLIIDVMHVIS